MLDTPAQIVPNTLLRKGGVRLIFSILILLFVLGIPFVMYMRAPKDFPVSGSATIVPGETPGELGTALVEGNFIRSRFLFLSFLTLFGGEHKLAPGYYYFDKKHTVVRLAWQIARGDHNVELLKITIPEGKTVKEMADIFSKKLPLFDSALFIREGTPFEGYLFPETYFFYPQTTTSEVLAALNLMFEKKTNELFANSSGSRRTKEQLVIMASLIEREASGDDDRAIIAGILWNRYDAKMGLQVDASVAYANGILESALKKEHFAIDSPYNTYKYRGLPPGPISNPGVAALTAALYPAKTEYVYYLHDESGVTHYARTYKEHLLNIEKYLR